MAQSDRSSSFQPSRSLVAAWALLLIFVPIGGYLVYEIEHTIGLTAPRFWELLKSEPVFGLAMLDFTLTAAWAFLVILERVRPNDWRFWIIVPVFFVIPTLGIVLFLFLTRSRAPSSPGDPPAATPT